MLDCIDKNVRTTGLTLPWDYHANLHWKWPEAPTQRTFKSPPFHPKSKQFIPACRRAHRPGAVRGRWAIHQSSFIRAGDDRYPSSDPELARPQSWPQSEQPEFPRIGRRLLLPLLKLIPSLLSHSQTFAQLWSFSNGSSVDGCCSGELLISMLYQVFYEIKI